jgi:hypothetical protein
VQLPHGIAGKVECSHTRRAVYMLCISERTTSRPVASLLAQINEVRVPMCRSAINRPSVGISLRASLRSQRHLSASLPRTVAVVWPPLVPSLPAKMRNQGTRIGCCRRRCPPSPRASSRQSRPRVLLTLICHDDDQVFGRFGNMAQCLRPWDSGRAAATGHTIGHI